MRLMPNLIYPAARNSFSLSRASVQYLSCAQYWTYSLSVASTLNSSLMDSAKRQTNGIDLP